VRTVDNAIDGMLELGRAKADVVITDIIMPKLNGVDAIDAILKAFPAVRIIAISGGGKENRRVLHFDQTVRIARINRGRGAGTRRWQGA
jgi:DNA-binding NarL/FixJ family response regulator